MKHIIVTDNHLTIKTVSIELIRDRVEFRNFFDINAKTLSFKFQINKHIN